MVSNDIMAKDRIEVQRGSLEAAAKSSTIAKLSTELTGEALVPQKRPASSDGYSKTPISAADRTVKSPLEEERPRETHPRNTTNKRARGRKAQEPVKADMEARAKGGRSLDSMEPDTTNTIGDSNDMPQKLGEEARSYADETVPPLDERRLAASEQESVARRSDDRRGRKRTASSAGNDGDSGTPVAIRRSGRQRGAPPDRYAGVVVQEKAKPKVTRLRGEKGGNKSGASKRKKLGIDQLFSPENLTSRTSPWVDKIELSHVFSRDFMENVLTEEQRQKIISWLPECDLIYPNPSPDDDNAISKVDPQPQIDHRLWDNPIFKDALVNWQTDLAAGKYEHEYIARGKEANRRRMDGEFDNWKDEQFETFWGQKQKFYHDAVAGESSKVKIATLVEHHAFRVGDIFSMRRNFTGGILIRKEAKLIAIDSENYSMTFTYPTGTNEWEREGVENKTVEKVLSLTALENLLCKEDGRAPNPLPNGNAFKTIRVIRKGEDIGCVFDVRAKFYHQYLEDADRHGR